MNVEGNFIKNTSRTKNRFSKDPPVNSLTILGYQYNKNRFPQMEFSLNSDDGFLVGAGFSRKTHGFRNEPYSTFQRFSGLYSLSRGSYKFIYNGEFNHVFRDYDILLNGIFGYPTVANFFGFGNTTRVPSSPDYGFYRTRYRNVELEALVRKRYFERFHVMLGPYFYHYWNKYADNNGKILGTPTDVGLDSTSVYSQKTYLGGKIAALFDNRNNDIFPTRGVLWYNEFIATKGLNNNSHDLMRLRTDMTVYASLSDPAKIVAVVGIGGGKIFNENYEFFQTMNIGVGNNLHGFRKNRYSGQSSAYGSVELRVKLFELKSYFLPGPIGLTGFYDIGRVWVKGEDSNIWHSAYG